MPMIKRQELGRVEGQSHREFQVTAHTICPLTDRLLLTFFAS